MNLSEGKSRPSLSERESSGGAIARGGFGFQDNVLLSYIPQWLSYEGFTDLIVEAMGDIEARFFVPGIGFVREFIETKDHSVTPSEFWREVDRFRKMHRGAHGTYRWFTLISPGLSETLHPLRNSLRRVKGAYGFYDEGSAILENSYADFENCVLKIGRDQDDARFLFESVLIRDDVSLGLAADANIIGTITTDLPKFNCLTVAQVRNIVSRLKGLLRTGNMLRITRLEIEACLSQEEGLKAVIDSSPVYLRVSGQPRIGMGKVVEFDWAHFFGGDERRYPPPGEWARMIEHLSQTKQWILEYRNQRYISLSGEQRLPTFMAIGSVFPAVAGFVIEYQNRDGPWRTNAYPNSQTYKWAAEFVDGSLAQELAVTIGVVRNISTAVVTDLDKRGLGAIPKLHLFHPDPLVSPEQTNAAVEAAKAEIARAISHTGATRIHLYVAGPAQFSLFLGHRMKALCEVHTYVWAGRDGYSAACILSP